MHCSIRENQHGDTIVIPFNVTQLSPYQMALLQNTQGTVLQVVSAPQMAPCFLFSELLLNQGQLKVEHYIGNRVTFIKHPLFLTPLLGEVKTGAQCSVGD